MTLFKERHDPDYQGDPAEMLEDRGFHDDHDDHDADDHDHHDGKDGIECGVQARIHFPFSPGYLNLNHGSFGAIPSVVKDVQRSYQDASEARPDLFLRYTYPPLLSASRGAVAAYLDCPKSSLVFVPNATTGLNTVLRNLTFEPGHVAVYFSSIYASIEKTLFYLAETTPLRLHRIDLVYPLSDSAVASSFAGAVDALKGQGLRPRLAVIDIVSSVPGVLVPHGDLVASCRRHGILSVVDGAHSAGQLTPFSLSALDPDFYTSNLHKWLHVPRPCAVLYVPPRNQALVRSSLPTSHGFRPKTGTFNNPLPSGGGEPLNAFEANFEFTGTADNSPYLCVRKALEWRVRLTWRDMKGERAIGAYLIWLAREAGAVVSDRLGTSVMENEEGSLGQCAFANVSLPLEYDKVVDGGGHVDFDRVLEVARWVEKVLVEEKATFMAIYWHAGKWWVRCSAQVYLTVDDWRKGADWLAEICARVNSGEWKS